MLGLGCQCDSTNIIDFIIVLDYANVLQYYWGGFMSADEAFDFGLRLRQLREDRGMSRFTLAKKLGVSKETIYRYENNLQDPALNRIIQLAGIFQTSIDYLVGLDYSYTIKLPQLTNEQRVALNEFLRVFVRDLEKR